MLREAFRFFRYLWIDREMHSLLRQQQEVIHLQKQQILKTRLEASRAHLNVLLGWRISQEVPEIDQRDELDAAIQDLHDQVARLEEHVT